jgi:hypothetical protein
MAAAQEHIKKHNTVIVVDKDGNETEMPFPGSDEKRPSVSTTMLRCTSALVAQSGHANRDPQCPLSGVKRTSGQQN